MTKINVTSDIDFISIGANCLGDCLVWGKNNLAAYGAQNFVAIVDPIKSKVLNTLPAHKDRVNHVIWLPNVLEEYKNRYLSNEIELMSCSSDKTIISWIKDNNTFKVNQILTGHTDSVTNISTLDFPDGSMLLCSTSADNTVKIWKRLPITKENVEKNEIPKWEIIQSLDFNPRCMECCNFTFIPDTYIPILALGGLEPKIHIYIQNTDVSDKIQFKKLMALQGHQDWIKCLSFCTTDDGDVVLASSSQDFKIRLWKLSKFTAQQQQQLNADPSDRLLNSLSTQVGGVTSLSSKGYLFNCNNIKYIFILESVLSGHEDWVYSIHWKPTVSGADGKKHQEMVIISASMDKTAMIWKPDTNTGIWIDEYRVGDMGGNILGLYGALLSPDGQYIFAHGYNGAFHLWKFEGGMWHPQITISGHFGPVQDLSWSPDNSYFISCSTDRTIRLFSEWKKDGKSIESWNEIARPQIHGYDLECFTFVYKKTHVIVSGAEEKIMRVFVGSQNFVDTLANISKVAPVNDGTQRPLAANQPSLGLSNKPYFSDQDGNLVASQEEGDETKALMSGGGGGGDEGGDGGYFDGDEVPFNPEVLGEPPVEEHLLQSSLWPEVQKLYGHGNEMVAVACSYDGAYVASACRSSSADQATVRIWNTSNWKEVANLKGHTLTVVNISFSHDSQYLLGVSRDRMWTLWQRTENPAEPFVKVIAAPKAHGRIIWSGSWSHDDKYFATGARDKVVKVWCLQNIREKSALASTLPTFGSGVTCVEFAPKSFSNDNSYLLAVGEEDGKISIWKGDNVKDSTNIEWVQIHTILTHISHSSDVRRIRWRNSSTNNYQLVTCSTDNSVRVFNLNLNIE